MRYVLVNPDTGRRICGDKDFETKEEASHYGHRRTTTNWEVTTDLTLARKKKRKKAKRHE